MICLGFIRCKVILGFFVWVNIRVFFFFVSLRFRLENVGFVSEMRIIVYIDFISMKLRFGGLCFCVVASFFIIVYRVVFIYLYVLGVSRF